MPKNDKLLNAKALKYNEFYTQYSDIQYEINAYLDYNPDTFRDKVILCPCDDPEWSNFTRFFAQNFESLGIKKLISTSYAMESKNKINNYQFTLDDYLTNFETSSPKFDINKSSTSGKIFILEKDNNNSGNIDFDDLEWDYLKGDGDFRSDEVRKLRNEADIIITNPPFSLYREMIAWIFEANKKFLVIGNKGSSTYKEIFPLIKNNLMWSGRTEWGGGMWFESGDPTNVDKVIDGKNMKNVPSTWFTNLEHGRRHEPLELMTMADNLKFSKHKEITEKGYLSYYNYDAIDVPFTDAIPSDYDGIMGVPASFLEKYNPEQFEIIDNGSYAPKTLEHVAYKNKNIICYEKDGKPVWTTPYTVSERKAGNGLRLNENGLPGGLPYGRILIRKRRNHDN